MSAMNSAAAQVHDTLYQALVAAGVFVRNHEGDLYARYSPLARQIIRDYGRRVNVVRSERDGEWWCEVIGAFDPHWGK